MGLWFCVLAKIQGEFRARQCLLSLPVELFPPRDLFPSLSLSIALNPHQMRVPPTQCRSCEFQCFIPAGSSAIIPRSES